MKPLCGSQHPKAPAPALYKPAVLQDAARAPRFAFPPFFPPCTSWCVVSARGCIVGQNPCPEIRLVCTQYCQFSLAVWLQGRAMKWGKNSVFGAACVDPGWDPGGCAEEDRSGLLQGLCPLHAQHQPLPRMEISSISPTKSPKTLKRGGLPYPIAFSAARSLLRLEIGSSGCSCTPGAFT